MEAPAKPWLRSLKPGSYFLPGLKRLRDKRGYSIRELAKKSGLTPDTVWRLERLQRGAEAQTRRKLAKALEVPLKELRIPDEEVSDT